MNENQLIHNLEKCIIEKKNDIGQMDETQPSGQKRSNGADLSTRKIRAVYFPFSRGSWS